MSAKRKFTPCHRRPRQQNHLERHKAGIGAEKRFFDAVERHRHLLPSVISDITRTSLVMDKRGRADAVVVCTDHTRLYFDLKCSQRAYERSDKDNLAIPFIVTKEESGAELVGRFGILVVQEYAKVLSRQAEPLLAELAKQPRPPMLQAAE